MHTTTLFLNAFLILMTTGALAAVVRLGLRLRHTVGAETLHPSQPIPLTLIARENEERTLADAA